MRILVTGGAGYIGGITVKELLKDGHEVVIFDNLSNGHKETVQAPMVKGDLLDLTQMHALLDTYTFDSVIHFAAYTLAGESMEDPYKYFQNNIQGGLNLLQYMQEQKIPTIIFSSTCAIYGTPSKIPVDENEKQKPESVYGESKMLFEHILDWYGQIYGIQYVNLRYFNAAGATLDGGFGEDHNPETHIIPIAIDAALGKRESFTLYGEDYPTTDGTCIRDYIHVLDLAKAHILAMEYLKKSKKSNSFNLGTGKGYSNREVLEMVKRVSGKEIKIVPGDRRPGDPPVIFADNTKAAKELGFQPEFSDLETIVKSAWEWHSKKK